MHVLKMFVNNLKICALILLEICVTTSEPALEATFKNVEVGGKTVGDKYVKTNVSHAFSLKENPVCRDLKTIVNIIGDVSVLQENSVSDLLELEEFTISGGNLNEIKPGAFRNVPKLHTVRIQKCNLTQLKSGMFTYFLTHLLLDHNNIDTISSNAFENMAGLEKIDLSYNALSTWNKLWFVVQLNLNSLIFSHNRFEELPDKAFHNLFLGPNTTVDFAHNKIVSVGRDLFKNFTTIQLLDLSHNEIKTFGDDVLSGLSYLGTLDLTGNQIECFDGDTTKIFIAREWTKVKGNPIKCRDRLSKMREEFLIRAD